MRSLPIRAAAVFLLVLLSGVAAAQVEHPNLLFNRPKQVVMSRALMLTKDYLADFFWATSPTEHVYDWALHGFGRLQYDRQKFQPSQDLEPYRWIKDVAKYTTAEPWSVEWVQQSAGVVNCRITSS